MIDIKTKYQASIFVNASDIIPSPDNITGLIEAFRDRELIPNTFREISPQSPVPEVRLQLSSATGEWSIRFASTRINIEKNATDPQGDNLGDLGEFCSDASDFFERILERFRRRANRLSLVTNFVLREMTASALSGVYLKLFRPPDFYRENAPFEWDWRSVSRRPFDVGEMREQVNALTIVRRASGQLTTQDAVVRLDRILLSFDINTIPEAGEYRFELSHIRDFYDDVANLHNDMLQGILEFIDEQSN